MKRLDLNYVVHFHDLTQKPDEIFETEADTCYELICELDGLYPGIKDLLMTADGKSKAQNALVLSRKTMRAHAVHDLSEHIEDGDFITFL